MRSVLITFRSCDRDMLTTRQQRVRVDAVGAVAFLATGALLLLLLDSGVVMVSAAAAMGAKQQCGSRICAPLDYCSPLHEQCEPCERICSATHNYNGELCSTYCERECSDSGGGSL